MYFHGFLLKMPKGQRAEASRKTASQKSGPGALLFQREGPQGSTRYSKNNKGGLRGQPLPPPGSASLLPTSTGNHRQSACTHASACAHTHARTHIQTHVRSSSGLSRGHSQPDRLSLPILCFLCLSGQGVRFRRTRESMVTVLGRSSPASAYPSAPWHLLLLLGGWVGEQRDQAAWRRGTANHPSGLWAPIRGAS